LHTRLAADTSIIVEIDNAVFTGKQGIGRADGCAGCILTMVASMDAEFSRRIWIGTSFDVLDVGSINPDGHIMLRLASHRTGVTSNAGPIVDDESIVDHLVTSHLQG
jgi:hypothetical protein